MDTEIDSRADDFVSSLQVGKYVTVANLSSKLKITAKVNQNLHYWIHMVYAASTSRRDQAGIKWKTWCHSDQERFEPTESRND